MITVRPLMRDDFDAWSALWRDYLAFYETSRPDVLHDAYFERLLGDNPRDFSARVAVLDGTLVGLTHYAFHPHGWQLEDCCYLQDLYADPQMRGKGIGRALIEAVYADADAKGAKGVYWNTQETNVTARKLYDRIGTLTPFLKYTRS